MGRKRWPVAVPSAASYTAAIVGAPQTGGCRPHLVWRRRSVARAVVNRYLGMARGSKANIVADRPIGRRGRSWGDQFRVGYRPEIVVNSLLFDVWQDELGPSVGIPVVELAARW